MSRGNKRPDLRRDCDSISSLHFIQPLFPWNKRPDLRRDCDIQYWYHVFIILGCVGKQTTWFTKGLRLLAHLVNILLAAAEKQTTWFTKGLRLTESALVTSGGTWRNKRPDLRRDCDFMMRFKFIIGSCILKQTTWFTKGLRHLWCGLNS